jgi:hypothetical protein
MTNEWAPPYTGFRNIVDTFRNTERPRPLTPVDVYYHFYIAERQIAFRTLTTVFDWCLRQNYSKLFVSEYLQIMNDLVDARLEEDGDWYRVLNQGKLPSIRFDGEPRQVDLSSAKGVLGFRHRWGSLYVFLDGGKEHRFRLTTGEQTGLRLLEASRPLEMLSRNEEGELLAFRSSGPGWAEFRFGGLDPGTYVSVRRVGGPATAHRDPILAIDARGELFIRARFGRSAEVHVESSSEASFRLNQWNVWFADEGRYMLLGLALSLLSWGLCRYHRPRFQPRSRTNKTPPGEEQLNETGHDSLETRENGEPQLVVEVGAATRGQPKEHLPAGGVGPWSSDMVAALQNRADEEEDS